jgi:hypothetical protein
MEQTKMANKLRREKNKKRKQEEPGWLSHIEEIIVVDISEKLIQHHNMIYIMFTRILSAQTQANSLLRLHGSIQWWEPILCEAYAGISSRRGDLRKWRIFLKKKSGYDNFTLTKPKVKKIDGPGNTSLARQLDIENWRARKHLACETARYRKLDADQQNAWFTTARQ